MSSDVTIPDEELARQCQQGSLAAFEELVRRYEARVYAYGVQSLRNTADAADLAQDTFLRAFQAIGQFNGKHSFAGWLFAIARHKCIDRHRSHRPAFESDSATIDENDPGRLMESEEDVAALWSLARRRLSDLQFQALWLRYAEDMDVQEIARVLRKSKVHIKVLLFRARQALATEIERMELGRGWFQPGSAPSRPNAASGPLKTTFVSQTNPPPVHAVRSEI